MNCPACGSPMDKSGTCTNEHCPTRTSDPTGGDWEPSDAELVVHTMEEWCEIKKVRILDPDGFREKDPERPDILSGIVDPQRKYTEEDFDRRLSICTQKKLS